MHNQNIPGIPEITDKVIREYWESLNAMRFDKTSEILKSYQKTIKEMERLVYNTKMPLGNEYATLMLPFTQWLIDEKAIHEN